VDQVSALSSTSHSRRPVTPDGMRMRRLLELRTFRSPRPIDKGFSRTPA
jgi:hypothetical protein